MKNRYNDVQQYDEKFEEISIEIMLYIEEQEKKEKSMLRQNRRKHLSYYDARDNETVEDIVIAKYIKDEITKALAVLTEKQRRRVYCYFYLCMNYTEIAIAEKTSDVAILLSIRAALRKMKKVLKNSSVYNQ